MSKRCLLTGANGYLGGLIAKKLRSAGWDVVPLVRNPKPGEIAFSLDSGVDASQLANADALIHCAYDFRPIEWRDIVAANVEGSKRLFEDARCGGVNRIVHISTISAFDGCKSNYGRAKLLIEAAAREAGAVVIRPALIYGASPGAMFGRLVSQVRAASLVPMPGDGRQLMFTVHEDDLTDAVFRAIEIPAAPPAPITVANEAPTAFRDIMKAIGARLNRNVTALPVPWQAMWLALRGAEIARVPIGLRSDSLVSLVNQDTAPVLNAERELGVRCRPFDLANVAL